MAKDCVFKYVLGKCPVKQKLDRSQPDGARLRNIIDASIRLGDMLICRSNWTPTKTCKKVITGLASHGIKHMHQNLKRVNGVTR